MTLLRTVTLAATISMSFGLLGCSQKDNQNELGNQYSSDTGRPHSQAQFTPTESIDAECNSKLLKSLPSATEIEGAKLSHTYCNFGEASRAWEKDGVIVEVNVADTQANPSGAIAATSIGEMAKKTQALKFGMAKQGVQILKESHDTLLAEPAVLSALGGERYLPFIYEFSTGDLAAVGVNEANGADNLIATYKDRYVIEVERSDREKYNDNQKAEAAYKPLFDLIDLTQLD